MFARYDDQSEVTVDQLHLDRRLSGGLTLGGGLCALRGRGLAVFVGILEDNVAILQVEKVSLEASVTLEWKK